MRTIRTTQSLAFDIVESQRARELRRLLTPFGAVCSETTLVSRLFYCRSGGGEAGCGVAQIFCGRAVAAMETDHNAWCRWREVTREILGLDTSVDDGEPWLYGWLVFGAMLCERAKWREPAAWEALQRVCLPRFYELPLSLSEARVTRSAREVRRLEQQLVAALIGEGPWVD